MRLLTYFSIIFVALASIAHAQTATYAKGSIYDLDPVVSQSTGSRILERISGSNDMQPVNEMAPDDIFRKLGRSVGRLALSHKGSKVSYCTASLIGKSLILTNHHCIPGLKKVIAAQFWLGYVKARSRVGVAHYPVNLKPVEMSEKFDYSILRVRGAPGDEWGTIKFGSTPLRPRKSLFLIHHPGGFAQHISRGRCQTSDPAVDGNDVLHVCDTIGGSSGAPIFDNSTRRVIGLHYSAVTLRGLNAGKRVASLVKVSPLIARLVKHHSSTVIAVELKYWDSVKDTKDPALLKTYLQRYPKGKFAPLAGVLIEKYEKQIKEQERARKALAQRKAEEEKKQQRADGAQRAVERKKIEARQAKELREARAEAKRTKAALKRAEEKRLAAQRAADKARLDKERAEKAALNARRKTQAVETAEKQKRKAEASKRAAERKKAAARQAEELRNARAALKAAEEKRLAAQAAAEAARKAKLEMEKRLAGQAKTKVAALSKPSAPAVALPAQKRSKEEIVRELQSQLTRIGCDPGAIDGQWGPRGRRALKAFTKHSKAAIQSFEPTQAAILDAVKAAKIRVCPKTRPNRRTRTKSKSKTPIALSEARENALSLMVEPTVNERLLRVLTRT